MTDRLPPHTKYVMESSSVWEATYHFMTETLGLDVTLSNPCQVDCDLHGAGCA